ncbi:MAG TPA: ABC transporter ATP-binding protein [Candidatus Alectryocaccobium stercorigallinarum]|nr:ABC transporter ATP-binding protein [Candidatus Alectryocaccobium stercorigallinarum]
MALLKLENLVSNYGSIKALKGISFEVNEGEIVTLIGANGAGKSTTMNTISGLKNLNGGKIIYDGQDISKWDARHKVKAGIVLSPEGRQVFPDFSVLDNLLMGGYLQTDSKNQEMLKTVYDLFPRLKEREKQPAGTLSGGEQQMLAVGRALMGQPRLLMLDEPSMGLAPLIVKEIFELIKRIRDMGTTVLLVEQNARVALKISDRAYVLETGKIVLSGKAEELLNSEEVQKAYLGI